MFGLKRFSVSRSWVQTSVTGLVLLCAAACGRVGSPQTSAVLNALGRESGYSGRDCTEPMRMNDAYLEEIGHDPSVPLGTSVPAFAKRAAVFCPQARPTIRLATPTEVSKLSGVFGDTLLRTFEGGIQVEAWLHLDVIGDKVVSLTIDLSKVPR